MEKYMIFNKNIPFAPLSLFDANKNSKVIELPLEMAKKYVEKLNQEYGEDLFFYMEREKWMEMILSPQFIEEQEKIHEEAKKIMAIPEIRKKQKELCEENDKNINGFMIPFEAVNNEDYEKKLKEKLNDFAKTIDRPAYRKDGTIVNDVKVICKMVMDAFDASKIGDTKKAEKIVEKILEEYKGLSFAITELDKSYAFRGVAPFDKLKQKWVPEEENETMMDGDLNFFRARIVKKSEILEKKEEINYLPYSMRDYANDMRFSSKGNICLYLGTTSYVCSKECRWNGVDNLYLSSFKFNEEGKKLKILNLVVTQSLLNVTISRPMDNPYCVQLHNAMIRVFPLVIATMFTITSSDEERRKFDGENAIKAEYLLSQVIMNVLSKAGIDGVAYLSRQGKDDFQYPQMVCLAIPIDDSNEENQYGELINSYVMTPPVLYNGFSDDITYEEKSYINEKYPRMSKHSWGENENYSAKIDFDGKQVFYQDTPFSKMDDYLINQAHRKFVYK